MIAAPNAAAVPQNSRRLIRLFDGSLTTLTPSPSPTLRERGASDYWLSSPFALWHKRKDTNRTALQSPLSRSVGEGLGVRVYR